MNRTTIIMMATAALAACSEAGSLPEANAAPEPEFIAMPPPGISAMVIPEGATPEQFEVWARKHCGTLEFCQVMGWTDPARAARVFPMSDREVEAIAFSFKVNRSTDFEQVVWDCKRFPQKDPLNCL